MNHRQPSTLFIVKQFYSYDGDCAISTGLKTSAQFVVNMLLQEGHKARLEVAIDGNSINALVKLYDPTEVVLEAIWVTPKKLEELMKLWPKVKWTVRIHSETPFLANEGSAIAWIAEYIKLGARVAFNSPRTAEDLSILGKTDYLPNYYPLRKPRRLSPAKGRLDIGCFGAIRPLKNQLIQAVAAITYAKKQGLPLYFHMNGPRIEQSGNNNLRNIQALFAATREHLVLHTWLDHEPFLELNAQMNICLQVSLSESFNIVSADAVSIGVPLVGSSAISWLPKRSQAKTDSAASIVAAMERADATTVAMNCEALTGYLEQTVDIWNAWVA